MADAYLTTANVAEFNRTDLDILVSDVLDDAPLVARLAARTCREITHVYTKQTANPAVGFRSVNDGIENKKGTYSKVTVNLGLLDASFAVDVGAAMSDERGLDHIMGIEAMAHLRQAMFEVESQVIYGTGNDAGGFSGFANFTNLDGLADAQVVNAGGTTAGTGSSVWLIRSGPADVELLWGQSGVITIGDRQIVERAGSVTGRFPAYYHPITGWCGVAAKSVYSVVRIANITEDAGKGLTDDLIAQALALFPAGRGPNMMVMSRRSHRQLQQSRTATNALGTPSPFPVESFGVQIIVSDAVLNTETLLA